MNKQILFRADGETNTPTPEPAALPSMETPTIGLPSQSQLEAFMAGRSMVEPTMKRPLLKVGKCQFSLADLLLMLIALCVLLIAVKVLRRN